MTIVCLYEKQIKTVPREVQLFNQNVLLSKLYQLIIEEQALCITSLNVLPDRAL